MEIHFPFYILSAFMIAMVAFMSFFACSCFCYCLHHMCRKRPRVENDTLTTRASQTRENLNTLATRRPSPSHFDKDVEVEMEPMNLAPINQGSDEMVEL